MFTEHFPFQSLVKSKWPSNQSQQSMNKGQEPLEITKKVFLLLSFDGLKEHSFCALIGWYLRSVHHSSH